MKRIIYALTCPITEDVHYIGKSTRDVVRPLQHMKQSHSEKVAGWIYQLKSIGQTPGVKILEKVAYDDDLDERETYWIQKYISKGSYLFNVNKVTPALVNSKLEKLLSELDYGDISDIAYFVKERRKATGLKQNEFADRAGVALTVIRKIEQGKTNINLDGLLQVLSMFGHRLEVAKVKV